MKQRSLARWLKAVLIGLGLCGLLLYAVIFPEIGRETAAANPEFAWCFWPWLIFLWVTGLPCYAVLVLGWRISVNIGRDRSFCTENARCLKWTAWLAAGDSAFFFVVNVAYLFLGMSHPGVLLGSLAVVFAGVCVTVAAAALSHLVEKAADLQEQSNLTI